VLVQAAASTQSLLRDVQTGVCHAVLASTGHSAPRSLVSHCSRPTPRLPTFRVTIRPAARRLTISGVPGIAPIDLRRHRCPTGLCITPLA
jgi:hypothetical protein